MAFSRRHHRQSKGCLAAALNVEEGAMAFIWEKERVTLAKIINPRTRMTKSGEDGIFSWAKVTYSLVVICIISDWRFAWKK